jgi:hypothetical protein
MAATNLAPDSCLVNDIGSPCGPTAARTAATVAICVILVAADRRG